MKKTMSLLLVAVLLIACMTTTAFAAKAGETVNVIMTATGSEPFTDFDVNLVYDSSVLTITGTPIGGFGYLHGGMADWAVTENVTSANVFNLTVAIAPNAEHKTYTITGTSNHAYNQAAEAAGTVTVYAEVIVECDYTFKTEVIDPTCTEAGYTRHYCECGKYIDDTSVSATGHNWGEWTVTDEATCTENGSKTRTCLNGCGETETEVIEATGHDHKLTNSTTGADCKTPGKDTFTCACGDTYTVDNDKFGDHKYEAVANEGKHTHNWVCSVCEAVGVENEACTDSNKDGKCDHCGQEMKKEDPRPTEPGIPPTGDSTPYPVFFMMAIAAVMGTAYGFKRKFVK